MIKCKKCWCDPRTRIGNKGNVRGKAKEFQRAAPSLPQDLPTYSLGKSVHLHLLYALKRSFIDLQSSQVQDTSLERGWILQASPKSWMHSLPASLKIKLQKWRSLRSAVPTTLTWDDWCPTWPRMIGASQRLSWWMKTLVLQSVDPTPDPLALSICDSRTGPHLKARYNSWVILSRWNRCFWEAVQSSESGTVFKSLLVESFGGAKPAECIFSILLVLSGCDGKMWTHSSFWDQGTGGRNQFW